MLLHADLLRQCFQWLTVSEVCKMDVCNKKNSCIVREKQIMWKFLLYRDFAVDAIQHFLFDMCVIESMDAKEVYRYSKSELSPDEWMAMARQGLGPMPTCEEMKNAIPYIIRAVCKTPLHPSNFISLADINMYLFVHGENCSFRDKSERYLDLLFGYAISNDKFVSNWDFMGVFYAEYHNDNERSLYCLKRGFENRSFDCFLSMVKYHSNKLDIAFFQKAYNSFLLPEERAQILHRKAVLTSKTEQYPYDLLEALRVSHSIEVAVLSDLYTFCEHRKDDVLSLLYYKAFLNELGGIGGCEPERFTILCRVVELDTFENASKLFYEMETKNISNHQFADLTISFLKNCFRTGHSDMLATVVKPLVGSKHLGLQSYLCVYYFKKGKISQAVTAGKRAYRRNNPNSFNTRYLARAYLKLRWVKKAEFLLNGYMKKDPRNRAIQLEMALFCLITKKNLNKVNDFIRCAQNDGVKSFDYDETLRIVSSLQLTN